MNSVQPQIEAVKLLSNNSIMSIIFPARLNSTNKSAAVVTAALHRNIPQNKYTSVKRRDDSKSLRKVKLNKTSPVFILDGVHLFH